MGHIAGFPCFAIRNLDPKESGSAGSHTPDSWQDHGQNQYLLTLAEAPTTVNSGMRETSLVG